MNQGANSSLDNITENQSINLMETKLEVNREIPVRLYNRVIRNTKVENRYEVVS